MRQVATLRDQIATLLGNHNSSTIEVLKQAIRIAVDDIVVPDHPAAVSSDCAWLSRIVRVGSDYVSEEVLSDVALMVSETRTAQAPRLLHVLSRFGAGVSLTSYLEQCLASQESHKRVGLVLLAHLDKLPVGAAELQSADAWYTTLPKEMMQSLDTSHAADVLNFKAKITDNFVALVDAMTCRWLSSVRVEASGAGTQGQQT
jgi:hypothetical protein